MQDILSQAPKGGAISTLNGEFYEGGQFMPVLGLPKGANRKVKEVVHFSTPETDNIAEIKVVLGFSGKWMVVYRMAGQKNGRYPFNGTKEECILFAECVLAEKAKLNEVNGFLPCPTKFVVESSC